MASNEHCEMGSSSSFVVWLAFLQHSQNLFKLHASLGARRGKMLGAILGGLITPYEHVLNMFLMFRGECLSWWILMSEDAEDAEDMVF